jgi:hypothetical protein
MRLVVAKLAHSNTLPPMLFNLATAAAALERLSARRRRRHTKRNHRSSDKGECNLVDIGGGKAMMAAALIHNRAITPSGIR